LRLARALITAEPGIDRALCVTADRFPPGASYEQAYNLISDGAAACVVSRQPGRYRILAAAHVTNGAMVGAGDDETVGAYFTYTHRVVTAALDQAGVKAAELRWVVPQNTNPKAWLILARLLGLGPSTVVHAPTLADAAHVISADNVVNLAHLEASGAPRPGDTLLLTMAGFGMNWQALVLERQ
ncbi:MAG: 3-oxoacyl-[acyl-carrier-protein] synthase III C-terminal domain-containing protein, partial [Acidimicrobiales bacterium]